MQTHFLPPRPIAAFKVSYAAWARAPVQRIVIFVHGFRGHPLDSWRKFDELLPEDQTCVDMDYIFYGYDGFRNELVASAAEFREFLALVLNNPSEVWRDMLPIQSARAAFNYKEVIIVGHSLGAVVVRRALLDLCLSGSADTSAVKLIFFAPAHRGARLALLLSETLTGTPLLNMFAGAAKFFSPLISQLHPDSQELKDLLADTKQAIATGRYPCLTARDVFVATSERIVTNVAFCDDPPPIAIVGSHTSICKPSSELSPSLGKFIQSIRGRAARA